jgi:hypothetical protein
MATVPDVTMDVKASVDVDSPIEKLRSQCERTIKVTLKTVCQPQTRKSA